MYGQQTSQHYKGKPSMVWNIQAWGNVLECNIQAEGETSIDWPILAPPS